jgi:predicted LPLAT superfamily acyltransferase
MTKSTHWSEIGESSLVWGMRFLLRVYLLLGRGVLQCFLYPVVSYYWLVNKTGRSASLAYLKRLSEFEPTLNLPGDLWGSYCHFISFANAIIDKLAAWSGALSLADVEYRGRDELLAAIKSGKGALLLGSHLGNLEVCRVIAQLDDAIRINVLVHTKHAQKINQLFRQINPNSGLNLIQVTDISVATSVLLSDKIDNGELVIITADRTPVSPNPRVSQVKFLGADALFPQGPFILASLLKCPVYTLFCLKQKSKHIIYLEHFSDELLFPRKTREHDMQQTIQRYAQRLEHYCLLAPLQWFNFFDFWRLNE